MSDVLTSTDKFLTFAFEMVGHQLSIDGHTIGEIASVVQEKGSHRIVIRIKSRSVIIVDPTDPRQRPQRQARGLEFMFGHRDGQYVPLTRCVVMP